LSAMAKSPEPDKPAKVEARKPMHGTQPGDKVSGDRLVVECRKPDRGWETIRMSGQHHGYRVVARMNAMAIVEVGYTNVRPA
jgi:hypothetical protein